MDSFRHAASIFALDEILSRDEQKKILGGYDDPIGCPYSACSVRLTSGTIVYGHCEAGWTNSWGQVMGCSCRTEGQFDGSNPGWESCRM